MSDPDQNSLWPANFDPNPCPAGIIPGLLMLFLGAVLAHLSLVAAWNGGLGRKMVSFLWRVAVWGFWVAWKCQDSFISIIFCVVPEMVGPQSSLRSRHWNLWDFHLGCHSRGLPFFLMLRVPNRISILGRDSVCVNINKLWTRPIGHIHWLNRGIAVTIDDMFSWVAHIILSPSPWRWS